MSTGSFCVSFPIIFEDGVFWLLRIRCPPQESDLKSEVWEHSLRTFAAVSSMIDSSVTTIKYVQTHSQIPVPTVHFYDSGYDNVFLAPYIVMDYIDGLPAPWSDIDLENEKQSTNFYSQLCGISLAMSKLRFRQSGYIQSISSDPPIIGALHEWDGKQYGSFQRAIDYYRQLVDNYWKHACGGCTTKATLPNDWNWTVALSEEKDLFTAYLHRACLAKLEKHEIDNEFCLRHIDLKFRNVLVKGEEIVGVLDWDECSCVPVIGYDPVPFADREERDKCMKIFSQLESDGGGDMIISKNYYNSGQISRDVAAAVSGLVCQRNY